LELNTDMNSLIEKYAKISDKSEVYVENLWNQLEETMLSQGMFREDVRFNVYVSTLLKKKLKIKESNPTLKRFKQFLQEKLDKKK